MNGKKTRKKTVWSVALAVIVALAVWVSQRWNVWFHNVEEEPYVMSAEPSRVLLTFGDDDGLSSRNVSWQCDSVVRPSWVELAADGDTVRVEAKGEVFVSRSGQAAYYVARLRQLSPGRQYAYRVVTDGNPSAWYTFSTRGTDRGEMKPDEVSFLYVGDVQDTIGGAANRFLREAFSRHPRSEFLVCGGDLTERPTHQHWTETFRDLDSIGQHVPLLCVTGNHDYLKGVIMRLERRFPLTLSYFLDSKVDDNMVYTLRYGPAQFFLLDSNREFFYLTAQRSWLERQLKASTAKWKIVVLHHPLFSIKGNNNLIQRWMFNDLITDYGADLVLQGHEHAYARMTNGGTTPVYTVSHCSPKNYRIQFSDRFDKFGISSRYYQTVSISADTLTMAAYEVYGHTLYDSLRIIKQKPQPRIEDHGRQIPEYLEFTPEPGSKKDRQYMERINDYKRLKGLHSSSL